MSFVGRPTYERMHVCLSGCQESENQLMALIEDQDVTTPMEKKKKTGAKVYLGDGLILTLGERHS